MSGVLKARLAFFIAIGLLLACALTVYGTVRGFVEKEHEIQQAQHVQVLLGETESTIASAARARLNYVFTGDEQIIGQYQDAVKQVSAKLAQLRQSTSDDPKQQAQCDRLDQLVNERIQLWEKSIALKKSGVPSTAGQPDLTRQSVAFADEIISVTNAMATEEANHLSVRQSGAKVSLFFTTMFLRVSFATAVLLLFWHYRLIREELRAREQAEHHTREAAQQAMEAEHQARESENVAMASNDAARQLSARLMHLQDDERRRLSRELHDSTGQHMAAAKMMLSSLAAAHPADSRYAECVTLVDRSLQEIRTISHLLHPSGLEEAGFSQAARWYAQEFAKRSGIQLKVDVSDLKERLPRDIEIALFRVLQEGLSNIHRHSKSSSAEIYFKADSGWLTLLIQDHGVGIPRELVERFHASGFSGVGLSAMRERIRELKGDFEIESKGAGTTLRAKIPVPAEFAAAAHD